MGLLKDAHITTSQFSLLALVFYVTYLAFELPTGYLMQRLPTAKYLGANVILWGLCVALNSVCKNFGSLVAVRVLLGVFESAVAPALILITTMWYKRDEQPKVGDDCLLHSSLYTDDCFQRIGFWYIGTGCGVIM